MRSCCCCQQVGGGAVLYTIPFSHYCEAARWALTLAGEEFTEAPYLPGVHIFFSPIARFREKGHAPADYTGDKATTPLLVSNSGEVLAYDSWQCLMRYGKGCPTARVKELLDVVVGPSTRTIVYSHLLVGAAGDEALLKMCASPEVPWWQRLLFQKAPFRQKVKEKMHEGMVKSPEHVDACRAALWEALSELEPLLDEEPFAGPEPSVAGIALATLLAPVLMPPQYCVAFYKAELLPLSEAPAELQEEVRTWRKTRAGSWALEYFARHRLA